MNTNIDKDLLKSLLVMADVIEARDTYTGGHVWRVAQFAKLLALELGLPKDEAIHVSIGGFLHDLGKVGIPDSILRKKDKLDAAEFATVQTHPSIGADLIKEHPLGALVLDMILHHHERLDGSGYPHGLDGDAIPLLTQIISLADSFDAMTSSRPYRKGIRLEDALAILTKESGSRFDLKLVEALRALSLRPNLLHVVGHSDEGIPLIDCPACGAVFAIPRQTQDGDIAFCRTCTGKMTMHLTGETFHPEFMGVTGSAQEVQPVPNMDVIADFVKQIPK